MSFRVVQLVTEAMLFTLVVSGTVTVGVPWWILRRDGGQPPQTWGAVEVASVLALVVGVVVYAWCLWEFVNGGRGIPAPLDHPKQLVVTGLYRYVRNPMYLGVLFILVGETIVFRSVALLLFTAGWFFVIHVAVVLYEEPVLKRKFSVRYGQYCTAVNRWVPRRPAERTSVGCGKSSRPRS